MSQTVIVPVLPLDDEVVLPQMVVPLDLADADTRTAIEAAQVGTRENGVRTPGIRSNTDSGAQVLLVPRLDGDYGAIGALGTIEQIGRLPGGGKAAVIRTTARARIGAGTTGPGAALWVQAEVVEETGADEVSKDTIRDYKAVIASILQQRQRGRDGRLGPEDGRPVGPVGSVRLRVIPGQRPEEAAAGDH